jgi:hypothetical protein
LCHPSVRVARIHVDALTNVNLRDLGFSFHVM